MSLNVPPLRRDQDPPKSGFTRFFHKVVMASGLATAGFSIAYIPEEIELVKQLNSTPPPKTLNISSKQIDLAGAQLFSLAVLGMSFICWRCSLRDDEHEWMQRVNESMKEYYKNKNEDAL